MIYYTNQILNKSRNIDLYIEKAADRYGVSAADINSPLRVQPIAEARFYAMYLIRKHTGMSYAEIGRRLGNRDRTTVIHAVTVYQNRLDNDQLLCV